MLRSSVTLGRTVKRQKVMMRQLLNNFSRHGRIKTTLSRAKQLKRLFDRTVSLFARGQYSKVGYVQKSNWAYFRHLGQTVVGGGYLCVQKLSQRQDSTIKVLVFPAHRVNESLRQRSTPQ